MLVLNPKLAILDETDSGLDVDAIRTVSKGIEMYKNAENAVLIITHNTRILENLKVDYVHILVDGKNCEKLEMQVWHKRLKKMDIHNINKGLKNNYNFGYVKFHLYNKKRSSLLYIVQYSN